MPRMRTLLALAVAASPSFLRADPPLPTFASTIYDITVPNAAINGGVAASTASSDNSAAINAYITYCNSHGGGTVLIPAGTFLSANTITMKSNVNLNFATSSSTLKLTNINNSLLKCSSGSNMAISGSGTIDGGATTTIGSANLVDLRGVTTLAVTGVTICNAAHEHFTPINDSNVTVANVTIHDNGTLAANGGAYLANTDAIDYAGNNFLFKNLNINAGDDDIVAKPASYHVSNIVITDCVIGRGHGISFGGGSAQGVDNVLIKNITMTGTDNGIRFKASQSSSGNAGGGTAHPVQNVTVQNVSMTNVPNPLVIDSFYDNGSNLFPTAPNGTSYSATPTTPIASTPIWQNFTFENITATGSSNAGLIYGLNTSPSNTNILDFNNVHISANSHMNMWYATNVSTSGLVLTVPSGDAYKNAAPIPGAYLSNYSLATTVPVTWTGAADNTTWNAFAVNFKDNSSVPDTYADPAAVTFDDSAPAAARTITLNMPASPATLTINSSASSYIIQGLGFLTGAGSIVKSGTGSATIAVPLSMTGATAVNVGTLILSSGTSSISHSLASITGAGNLTIAASTSLTSDGIRVNNLTLNGPATIRSNGASTGTSQLSTLTLAGAPGAWTSKLDITNNTLLIQATANKSAALATLANQLLSASNGGPAGTWTGNGITSASLLNDRSSNNTNTTLSLADNADLNGGAGLASYAGLSLNTSSLIITRALIGDANLDKSVDLADYDLWFSHVGSPGNATSRGDFNLDGQIDLADYDAWFSHVGAALPLTAATSPIPEPTSLALLPLTTPLLLKRRRH